MPGTTRIISTPQSLADDARRLLRQQPSTPQYDLVPDDRPRTRVVVNPDGSVPNQEVPIFPHLAPPEPVRRRPRNPVESDYEMRERWSRQANQMARAKQDRD